MKTETDPSKFGLTESTIKLINAVFASHPQIEQVILYGSRAKGNYRVGSDIDLTMVGGDITLSDLMNIDAELDDLLLPYKIDLSLLHKIDDPDLVDHIKRVGAVFFQKAK